MNLNERQEQERKYYAGLELFEVIAVNPTTKQINEIYGKENSEEDKEVEYVDQKDGDDRVRITVFMRGQQTNRIHRESFFITNKPRVSDKGSKQYINQICQSTWVDEESNLPEWFTKFYGKDRQTVVGEKTYRQAKEGEADFYNFVRGVLNKVAYNLVSTDVEFDFKKFLRGDFVQLNSTLTNKKYAGSFCALNFVRTDANDSTKQYQQIYNKAILPANFYNKIEVGGMDYYNSYLDQIKENPGEVPGIPLTINDIYGYVPSFTDVKFKDFDAKVWKAFLDNVEGEYGCKGFYKICPVFEYDKAMDIAASNKVISSDGSDY